MFDFSYLLFLLPGIILSLWAQVKVKSTFNKYNNYPTRQGLTGAQAARYILDSNGLHGVSIERVAGNLTDHYDPKTNVVRLSDSTYGNASVGAVGVAAHECGHAVQYAQSYWPIKMRSAIVPICNIGSSLSVPLILIGFVLNILNLVYIGIVLFSLVVLFQLITLPVEFNASQRAITALDNSGMVTPDESMGVRKVLTAAALTYVAALLTSLLQLLYYVSLAGRRRR